MTSAVNKCPCCDSTSVEVFHRARRVPVNSVLALKTKQEALEFPTGDIELGFCGACGFIYNTAFDPKLLEYSERYDPTQSFSETFNVWHRQLATDLIERFGLQGKRVIEIGCGKGEFLHLLAEIGGVEGVGFDPAYEPSRDLDVSSGKLEFVADLYSKKYSDVKGDAICCKMTLEHIAPARQFVDVVKKAVGEGSDAVVLFQVPDVQRILEEAAFWDIYYEHCSYFSSGSLARLFDRCGFKVASVRREYGDQYLMLEARASGLVAGEAAPLDDDVASLRALVTEFENRLATLHAEWSDRLERFQKEGKSVVVWGSGSKGVSFLTTLGVDVGIEYVVDINTFRQGHFMAGSGQQIVSPQFLVDYEPDVVIVMNPMYRGEIDRDLVAMGLQPEVMTA